MEWHGMPNNRAKIERNSESRRKINETDGECVHKCHLEIYFSIRRPIVNQLQRVIDFSELKTTFIASLPIFDSLSLLHASFHLLAYGQWHIHMHVFE